VTTHRHRIATVATAALLASCAPDEFKPSPGYDGFLDLIGQVCYPDTINGVLVRELAKGYASASAAAGFLDWTSDLYYGKLSPENYRKNILAFSSGGTATNKAIDCIIANLPGARPAAGGRPGGGMSRDGVPPPPPQ
jgi:hypothetical protein